VKGSAFRALTFIAAATARNMLKRQLRRMRQPRYLLATLLGLFYVVNLFVQPGMGSAVRHAGPAHTASPLIAGGLIWWGTLVLLFAWVFGGDEGGLAFSEAEIQFLFPAPLSRRQLIHYKLLRSLLFALFSSLIFTVSVGRRLRGGPPFFALGAWLGVATLSLHLTAASLTRLSLVQHGVRGGLRRLLALAVPLAIVGALAFGVLRSPYPWPSHYAEVAPYLEHLLDAPSVTWAGMVVAPAVHVALAHDLPELLRWLPAAAGVLALHYLWALSTDAAFEQASLASSERRSKRMEGLRRGQLTVRGTARPPFALSPHGHPAFAIYWKNLTAAVRLLSLRVTIVLLMPAVMGAVGALSGGAALNRGLGAILCGLLAGSSAFFGVQVYRIDFRLDLVNIDQLRSYPLRGVDLALAEVLAPFTVLTVAQWIFLVAGAVLAPPDLIPGQARLPVLAAAMMALPAFTLCGLIVQNAAALLFPSWVETGTGPPRGVEAIGQRLVTLVGTLLAVAVALIPAALVGVPAALLLRGVVGSAAVAVGALAGTLVVALEAGFAFLGLGKAFDRFDPGR